MMILKVKDTEYKVKFGYNSFCDTDLLDRTSDLLKVFSANKVVDEKDVFGMGKIKDLFSCLRELLFVGFEKYNPVDHITTIGNILDDYKEENTEEEPHNLLELFTRVAEELMTEGFFADLMGALTNQTENQSAPINVVK